MQRFGAIDVGGTGIKYGVVDAGGVTVWEDSVATLAEQGRDAVVGRICDVVRLIEQRSPDVAAFGLGVPGIVDPDTKHVQAPPNLPGWDDVDLLASIRTVTSKPVDLENDANAAALAEAHMGAGAEHPNFLYATLGTGIGGGIILDGKLYRGPHGDAGEIGHIILDAWAVEGARDPRPFRTSVLEDHVGNAGIVQMARQAGHDVQSVQEITDEAVLREAGRVIGIGMCTAMAVLGLRVLIIGGGVSQAPFIIETITATIKHRAIPTIAANAIVLPARFGAHAGLFGAAAVGRAVIAR
ncbi:MAG: ROK family protein [Candidatus Kapabacteria bacterium]|nr:ROK family protein [Candidatus Kapabacteria bacterium]